MGSTIDRGLQLRQVAEMQRQTKFLAAIARGEDPEVLEREQRREAKRRIWMTVCWIVGIIFPPLWVFPIVSIARKRRATTGAVQASQSEIETVKSDLEPLADAVRQGVATQHAAPGAASPASADDAYEALRKLASLRDVGALTAEEFEAKKQELLGRM